MDEERNLQDKKCFIITPIGNEDSDIFRRAKGVIESAIKPVLEKYGYVDIKPAYEINISGMINTQIINRIIEDDLVIANLTENNPNVMYELCLRHVVAKPIIHICERETKLPFDIKDSRTIFYDNDMLGVEEFKNKLKKFMNEISYEKAYMDNPIYNAYKYGKLLKETEGTENNEIIKLLVKLLGEVEEIKECNSYYQRTQDEVQTIGVKEIYTIGQMQRDMKSINTERAKRLLQNERQCAIRVHELAKELNTTSQVIIRIMNLIGIGDKKTMSSIENGELKQFLEFVSHQTF